MSKKLTSKPLLQGTRLKICRCYYNRMKDRKLPPTFQEVADDVGLYNTSTVSHHIKKMVKEGIISRPYGERNYRNYELTKNGIRYVERTLNIEPFEFVPGIPVLGTTAAGQEPRFIVGERNEFGEQERIYIENELGDKDIYGVHVKGTSMIGDHINDGDYVFIRQQPTCDNGDIVVISQISTSIEQGLEGFGYATLKHFFDEKDGIYLRSSNPEVNDIFIPNNKRDNWRIEGKVIAVFRRLHSS